MGMESGQATRVGMKLDGRIRSTGGRKRLAAYKGCVDTDNLSLFYIFSISGSKSQTGVSVIHIQSI